MDFKSRNKPVSKEELSELLSPANDKEIDNDFDPSDLVRLSIEKLTGINSLIPSIGSTGELRFYGDSVEHNQASSESIGKVLIGFQKLVTATAASLQGFTSSRGSLPSDIPLRTRINVVGSPQLGSVKFKISAAQSPLEEIAPSGDVPLLDEDRVPLIEKAIEKIISTLKSFADATLESELDPLAATFTELGPRFNLALKDFSLSTAKAHFDLDLKWRTPSKYTKGLTLEAAEANRIANFLDLMKLTTERVEFKGTVIHLSEINKNKLGIQIEDSQAILFSTDEINTDVLKELRLDEPVIVKAEVSHTVNNAGHKTTVSKALSITKA